MFKFSEFSLKNLYGVHPLLANCVHEAMDMQVMDFRVVEGVRSKERQKELFDAGKTQTMNSKHLIQSDGYGHAVDLYPYPIDMSKVNKGDAKEIYRFGVLNGMMQSVARRKNIIIVNGADWDRDGETLDHKFFDAPHFQIVLR